MSAYEIYPKRLPEYKPFYYDAEQQAIGYTYENGGMMVHGNNLSVQWVPLPDVIIDLLHRIETLERKLENSN